MDTKTCPFLLQSTPKPNMFARPLAITPIPTAVAQMLLVLNCCLGHAHFNNSCRKVEAYFLSALWTRKRGHFCFQKTPEPNTVARSLANTPLSIALAQVLLILICCLGHAHFDIHRSVKALNVIRKSTKTNAARQTLRTQR